MSRIEGLESRTLLSISLAPDGTLTVNGTSGPDIVEITGREAPSDPGANIRVKLNAATQEFHSSLVKKIVVNTGDGADTIYKKIFGEDGDNTPVDVTTTINAGAHADDISIQDEGLDVVNAGSGNDRIHSFSFGTDHDSVYGGSGDDELDILSGSYNLVHFFGEDGNDSVLERDNDSHVNFFGGNGTDTVRLSNLPGSGSVTLDNSFGDGFEGGDNIHNDVENVIVSSNGNLNIIGSDGPNNFTIRCEGLLTVDARGGNDVITLESGAESTLLGGAGDDKIYATSWRLEVRGGPGNDLIVGSPNNDFLYGEDGNDTIDGGLGADLIDGGGWGADVVDYSKRTFPLYVNIADGRANDGYGDEHDNVLANVEIVHGGSHNDVIVGNAANNVLNGNGGNDRIYGGAGNDVITGGPGQNWLYGESGNDTIFARWGSKDLIDGGPGFDSAQVDSGLDSIFNIENFI